MRRALITVMQPDPAVTNMEVTWSSQSTRLYTIDKVSVSTNASWADGGLGLQSPDGATTTRDVPDVVMTTRFFRVQAVYQKAETSERFQLCTG
ncbi:MAG: hypothetical protein KJ626_13710 [Verrucomicrobia bacterium]|nr:hypothetical protein [Verrucomicrobiota bacterium]